MTPIRATYRLQFHAGFRLSDAGRLVAYLHRLGASHIYASPLLRARSGSTHGYDVVDPHTLNPELGNEDELCELVDALHADGMGLLLDIVPNHMATGPENRPWEDVLTHGRTSRFARWFDIDWRTPESELTGRVLLPVLGRPRAHALSHGELRVAFVQGAFRITYFDQSFPLSPFSLAPVFEFVRDAIQNEPGETAGGPEHLDEFLAILNESCPPRPAAGDQARRRLRPQASADALRLLATILEKSTALQSLMGRALSAFPRGPEGVARMENLLARQFYLLAHWRRAAREINYRRFFDINDLVALRMEDPEVFADYHRVILGWAADGWLDALRIDHIDGLLDPLCYLQRLKAACPQRPDGADLPVYVEKILLRGEALRDDWPVAGTTGYEFLNDLESVFIDPEGCAAIEATYVRLARRRVSFSQLVTRAKERVLRDEFSSYIRRMARMAAALAPAYLPAAAPSRERLTEALVCWIARLGVYRTYVDDGRPCPAESDRRLIRETTERARQDHPAIADELELIDSFLLTTEDPSEERRRRRIQFVQRLQQLTGPAAAKGVEDTALYVHVPLVSRNEVGSEPDRPLKGAVLRLQETNQARAERRPDALLCVSTHDTKRSADVRARLDVLSEIPHRWRRHLVRWRRWNRTLRRRVGARVAPDANSEYLLYQTLVGIWPLPHAGRAPGTPPSLPDRQALAERVRAYMRKAGREAKTHTSWVNPNEPFESAVSAFVDGLLCAEQETPFLRDLSELVDSVARPGLWNALSRTLVHLTAPGVPDLYQGDELWNFSLVDPDNRRPVDFEERSRLLDEIESEWSATGETRRRLVRGLVETPENGRIKLHTIRRLLDARTRHVRLFGRSRYLRLDSRGAAAESVIGFARQADGLSLIAVAPRLVVRLLPSPWDAPVGERTWGDTSVLLPEDIAGTRFESLLTGQHVRPETVAGRRALSVAQALAEFPVAAFVGSS